MGANPTFALMIEENHEKPSIRLVGTGIRTRDLPNASLVRYHEATSLGSDVTVILREWILIESVKWISGKRFRDIRIHGN